MSGTNLTNSVHRRVNDLSFTVNQSCRESLLLNANGIQPQSPRSLRMPRTLGSRCCLGHPLLRHRAEHRSGTLAEFRSWTIGSLRDFRYLLWETRIEDRTPAAPPIYCNLTPAVRFWFSDF